MKYPPNFTYEEMIRSETATTYNIDNTPTKEHKRNLLITAWFLQGLKDALIIHFGENVKIHVTSGYRCFELNSHPKIAGSKESIHMIGLAADIICSHMTPYELSVFISKNMVETGYDNIINEFGRWVHIALSQKKPRFTSLTATRNDAGKVIYLPGLTNV